MAPAAAFWTGLLSVLLILSSAPAEASSDVAGSERTLAIVKPDGVSSNHVGEIKEIILASGFRILREKTVRLDEESAATFYSEHSPKKFFRNLVQYMISGPVLVMVLEKENAVDDWRMLIGPTDSSKAKITHPQSIRAMCGTNAEKNCVHGSDSDQSARREISFFFTLETSGGDVVGHDEL